VGETEVGDSDKRSGVVPNRFADMHRRCAYKGKLRVRSTDWQRFRFGEHVEILEFDVGFASYPRMSVQAFGTRYQ